MFGERNLSMFDIIDKNNYYSYSFFLFLCTSTLLHKRQTNFFVATFKIIEQVFDRFDINIYCCLYFKKREGFPKLS